MKKGQNFQYLDIFGFSPRFTILREKTFNTLYGFIMSILILGTIIYSIWHFGNEIFFKDKPRVIMTTYNDANPLRINLTDADFMIALGLQRPSYDFFIDETIYELIVNQNIITRKGDGITELAQNSIEIIKCSEKRIEILPNYFKGLDLKNVYCFKNASNIFIQGDFGRESWIYLDFSFRPCVNTTKNSNHCKSLESIKTELDGGYMGLFISDTTIEPSNFTYPNAIYGKNIYQTFSMRNFRDFWLYFKTIQVISDNGWLMENKIINNFFNFDFEKETWDYRDTDNGFFKLAIRCSSSRLVFERTYIKVQEIAANVGGIVKFLLICGEILVYYFRQLKYKEYLLNCFFDLHSNSRILEYNDSDSNEKLKEKKIAFEKNLFPNLKKINIYSNANDLNIIPFSQKQNQENKKNNNKYNNLKNCEVVKNVGEIKSNIQLCPSIINNINNKNFNAFNFMNKHGNRKSIRNLEIVKKNSSCNDKNSIDNNNNNNYNKDLQSENDSSNKRFDQSSQKRFNFFWKLNAEDNLNFIDNKNNNCKNNNNYNNYNPQREKNQIKENISNYFDIKLKNKADNSDCSNNLEPNIVRNFSFFESIRTICCCKNKRITKRMKLIDIAYQTLEIKFDWIHYLKFQNEYEFIKNILFTPEQNDIISLALKQNIRNEIHV